MPHRQKNELDDDEIVSFLQNIASKIKLEADPFELNHYRSLVRKAIPFTLRSYFAAYLLKEMYNNRLTGKSGRTTLQKDSRNRYEYKRHNENKSDRDASARLDNRRDEKHKAKSSRSGRVRLQEEKKVETRSTETAANETRYVIPDECSATLFINIGRNRRVYPRDLIGLIMQKTDIDRQHIGDIRVLDNYSFMQVLAEDAEGIISTLTDCEYRGRKLVVSYSHKREEQPVPVAGGSDSFNAIASGDNTEINAARDLACDSESATSEASVTCSIKSESGGSDNDIDKNNV